VSLLLRLKLPQTTLPGNGKRQLQTWHYGFIAKWRAEFNTPGLRFPTFSASSKRASPRSTSHAGTGRLLMPLGQLRDRYGRVLGEHQRLLLEARIVEQVTTRAEALALASDTLDVSGQYKALNGDAREYRNPARRRSRPGDLLGARDGADDVVARRGPHDGRVRSDRRVPAGASGGSVLHARRRRRRAPRRQQSSVHDRRGGARARACRVRQPRGAGSGSLERRGPAGTMSW
jgi:hypothetical protein